MGAIEDVMAYDQRYMERQRQYLKEDEANQVKWDAKAKQEARQALLDSFAQAALQGLLAGFYRQMAVHHATPSEPARGAYALAQAMLEERERLMEAEDE